jgi:hypothetical protein
MIVLLAGIRGRSRYTPIQYSNAIGKVVGVKGFEPSATRSQTTVQVVRVARVELAVSWSRTTRFTRLSYTLK